MADPRDLADAFEERPDVIEASDAQIFDARHAVQTDDEAGAETVADEAVHVAQQQAGDVLVQAADGAVADAEPPSPDADQGRRAQQAEEVAAAQVLATVTADPDHTSSQTPQPHTHDPLDGPDEEDGDDDSPFSDSETDDDDAIEAESEPETADPDLIDEDVEDHDAD